MSITIKSKRLNLILALLVNEDFLVSFEMKDLCDEVSKSDGVQQCMQVQLLVKAFTRLIVNLLPLAVFLEALTVLEARAKSENQPGP